MKAVKAGEFQIILEVRDEDLELVLKTHADVGEAFTMMDVQEPDDEALVEIVSAICRDLEKHHGIAIGEDAIGTAIELTGKYRVRDMSLSHAQPERALNLIDRALASYRQSAHTCPPAIASKRAACSGLAGEALAGLEAEIAAMEQDWRENRQQLREFSDKQRRGEQLLRDLEEALEQQQQQEAERDGDVNSSEGNGQPTYIGLGQRAKGAGFGSMEVMRLRSRIEEAETAINSNRDAFDALSRKINAELKLSSDEVLSQFSALSGISAEKLNQDERLKLLALEDTLKARVFGQDPVLEQLAGAVCVARAGLREPNKPQSAFLYAGPSGVGKTETAKALTAALMDDERALLRFDMSEYIEKHALAKLIGAPPGY